ncbi:endonuclease/exonuclease/phosphatase family protein [Labilithrix luteola]|nr:endonuclease/exonuclease/phosphatase family protein [Labilithrix luteola]
MKAPSTDGKAAAPLRWARARRVLFWAIVVELACFAFFLAILGIGERSRVALLALYAPRQPVLVATVLAAVVAPLTKRRLLVGLQGVACLIALFPVMGLHLGGARASEFPVRLASYNVFFGRLGRPALLDEIGAMQADIILLQATYSSMGERVKARFPDRSTHECDDFLLITRYPIVKVEEPPPLADGTPAKFVGYVLETDAGPLRVFNVHPFSPRQALFDDDQTNDNIRHREEQIAAVMAAVRRDDIPFVIAGDTNLPGLSATGRRYLGDLHDAFDDVGFGFGYTFPAKRPWMRIDRAFASDRIHFVDARVGKQGASDHRALFVEFEIDSHR